MATDALTKYRVVVPNYMGKRVEGPWMRDVPHYIEQAAKVWISREVSFTIEFAPPDRWRCRCGMPNHASKCDACGAAEYAGLVLAP